jgi:hypothetical protein
MRIIVVAPGDMRVMISCIVVLRAVMEADAVVRGGSMVAFGNFGARSV